MVKMITIYLSNAIFLISPPTGLWDITCNEKAVEICERTFQQFPLDDESKGENQDKENKNNQLNFKYRYISLAQDLGRSLTCY